MKSKTIDSMENFSLGVGNFGFSGARIDDLGATEYTLVCIAVDVSSSVESFKDEMERVLKEVVNACRHSPRADNLMIRFITFNNKLDEVHGFKLLADCNADDYTNCLHPGGMTALFDATHNSVKSVAEYAKTLVENDFDCNGILFVITDGAENASRLGLKTIKTAFEDVMKNEQLESLVTVLVGVNPQGASSDLNRFKTDVGFTQYIETKDSSAKELAKLAAFVSKSISSQSSALGTGGPSMQLSLTI